MNPTSQLDTYLADLNRDDGPYVSRATRVGPGLAFQDSDRYLVTSEDPGTGYQSLSHHVEVLPSGALFGAISTG